MILVCCVACGKTVLSQSDIQSWSSIRLTKPLNQRFVLKARPILRQNMDLSNLANVSIDLSLDYKPNRNWSFTFLHRYWWLEEGVNRYFWFLQVQYKRPLTSWVSISQTLRWHSAFDIEILDPDFVRSITHLNFPAIGKFKPSIGADLFFRLNQMNQLQRIRLKLGGTWSLGEYLNWNMQIWKQDRINQSTMFTQWIIVNTFTYTFKKRTQKE